MHLHSSLIIELIVGISLLKISNLSPSHSILSDSSFIVIETIEMKETILFALKLEGNFLLEMKNSPVDVISKKRLSFWFFRLTHSVMPNQYTLTNGRLRNGCDDKSFSFRFSLIQLVNMLNIIWMPFKNGINTQLFYW